MVHTAQVRNLIAIWRHSIRSPKKLAHPLHQKTCPQCLDIESSGRASFRNNDIYVPAISNDSLHSPPVCTGEQENVGFLSPRGDGRDFPRKLVRTSAFTPAGTWCFVEVFCIFYVPDHSKLVYRTHTRGCLTQVWPQQNFKSRERWSSLIRRCVLQHFRISPSWQRRLPPSRPRRPYSRLSRTTRSDLRSTRSSLKCSR